MVVARLKPAVAEIKSRPHRLIHGNPHLENISVGGGKILALRNWENAAIGDPRWDVMTAAYWIRGADSELAEQLVNWYETFSGQAITERPFWWALIAARLWALKSWVHYGVDNGQLPPSFAAWTENLAEAQERTYQDLDAAGL